jgi:hypothetical protein
MPVYYVADVSPDLKAEEIKDFDDFEFHLTIDKAVHQLIEVLLPIEDMTNATYLGYVYRINKKEHDLDVDIEIKEIIPISVYTKIEWRIGA